MSVARIVSVPSEGRPDTDARTRSGRAPGDGRPCLGIYAKTDSAPPGAALTVDPETGEDLGERPIDPRSSRAERYALKSVVNRLLPTSRTSKCMRWRVPKQELQIHKSNVHGRAFYSGLQVCASVWACPVCAAKISERRRADLVEAITTAKAQGLSVYLLTLTVPHGLGDDVRQVLDSMLAAWRKCTTSRAGSNVKKLIGLVGTVRALEVTHGANGFHPHLHVLLFLDGQLSPAAVQEAWRPLWQQACQRAGLPKPSDLHGCRVDDGSHAAAYASKWGLESEMTKGHTKKGKQGGRTPWDLLREVLSAGSDAAKCSALFRVYAEAFKGRRQLYWSNGLRALLELSQEATDEEIAAAQEDSSRVLAALTTEEWQAILATKSEAIVLNFAEDHPEALPVLLASLVAMSNAKSPDRRAVEREQVSRAGP